MDETFLRTKLGASIRERRLVLKLSQDAMADVVQMHRSYYSSIERGERNITVLTLCRVAQGLKDKAAELMRIAGL